MGWGLLIIIYTNAFKNIFIIIVPYFVIITVSILRNSASQVSLLFNDLTIKQI